MIELGRVGNPARRVDPREYGRQARVDQGLRRGGDVTAADGDAHISGTAGTSKARDLKRAIVRRSAPCREHRHVTAAPCPSLTTINSSRLRSWSAPVAGRSQCESIA